MSTFQMLELPNAISLENAHSLFCKPERYTDTNHSASVTDLMRMWESEEGRSQVVEILGIKIDYSLLFFLQLCYLLLLILSGDEIILGEDYTTSSSDGSSSDSRITARSGFGSQMNDDADAPEATNAPPGGQSLSSGSALGGGGGCPEEQTCHWRKAGIVLPALPQRFIDIGGWGGGLPGGWLRGGGPRWWTGRQPGD